MKIFLKLSVLLVFISLSLFPFVNKVRAQITSSQACTNWGVACRQSCKICNASKKCVSTTATTLPQEGAPSSTCSYCLTDADCESSTYFFSGVPGLPAGFMGTAKICGQDPPAGTKIYAKVCNTITYTSSFNEIYGGSYVYTVAVEGDKQCGLSKYGAVNGDPINFYIGSYPATVKGWSTTFKNAEFITWDIEACPPTPTPTPRTSFFDILSARICYNSRHYTRKVGGHDCYDGNYRYSYRVKNTGSQTGTAVTGFYDLHTGYLNFQDSFSVTAGGSIDRYITQSFELCGGPQLKVGPSLAIVDDTWSQAEASSVVACAAATSTPIPTPTTAPSRAWFQVQGGNVYANGDITDSIPSSFKFNDVLTDQAGAGVTYYDSNLNVGTGDKGKNASSSTAYPELFDYQQFFTRFTSEKTPLAFTTLKQSDLTDKGSLGNTVVYTKDGGIDLDEDWENFTGNMVIFVKGDLNINTQVTVTSGSFLGFIVSGNITVSEDVGSTQADETPDIEGFYFTDGTFSTGEGATPSVARLNLSGTFAARDGFNLQRNLTSGGNQNYPSETFKIRPDFGFTTPRELLRPYRFYQELNP